METVLVKESHQNNFKSQLIFPIITIQERDYEEGVSKCLTKRIALQAFYLGALTAEHVRVIYLQLISNLYFT